MDGICGRLYFSHVDSTGAASKPFLLPQKNPRFYYPLLRTYNLPELIARPFTIPPRKLVRAFCDNAHLRNAQLSADLRNRLQIPQKAAASDSISDEPWKRSATH
jgi:hypothetical protein